MDARARARAVRIFDLEKLFTNLNRLSVREGVQGEGTDGRTDGKNL